MSSEKTSSKPKRPNIPPKAPAATPAGPETAMPAMMTADCIDRFTRNFEASSRRWELVVYPSLFAFIILAAYGFYLVYSLSHDIHRLTNQVVHLTVAVDTMTRDMDIVADRMQSMNTTMSDISGKMDALPVMETSMKSIDRSASVMSANTDLMRYQMGHMNANMYNMNRSFTPGGMFSNFMPW